jgi:Ribosomal L32p protein family
MAVPKKKTSPSRRNMRRSHIALKTKLPVNNLYLTMFQLMVTIAADRFLFLKTEPPMRLNKLATRPF